ncbi:MAG: hypothetical protein SF053_14620 [Bacteroidia bacterium]|nr:hypothetical protein [Bacteroidia bacterium]
MMSKLFFACTLACLSVLTLSAQSGVSRSGVKYTILQAGTGPAPATGQEVLLHVEVTDNAGKVIFSSREMGCYVHETVGTAADPIDKAREELLMQMKQGSKYREEAPKSLLPADHPARKEAGDYLVAVIELAEVMEATPSGTHLIVETAEKSGVPAAEAQFKALQQHNPKGYTFFEWDMNMAGYKALEAKQYDQAVAFFTMNTTLHPASANAYDSLGDGYAAKGDKEKAKASYQKAFQLNPAFTFSKEKMDKL